MAVAGTPVGEAIREVLLHRSHAVSPWTEALLYAAARAQLVADVVRPSLRDGLIVVLDRYIDSSLADDDGYAADSADLSLTERQREIPRRAHRRAALSWVP